MLTMSQINKVTYFPWQALMALFVLASKDGWVNIMYTGLDAVGVDQQVRCTKTVYFYIMWLYIFLKDRKHTEILK